MDQGRDELFEPLVTPKSITPKVNFADRLLRAAEARGFHQFIANVSWDNVAIRKLLRGLGEIVSTKMSEGTSEFAFVRCRTK